MRGSDGEIKEPFYDHRENAEGSGGGACENDGKHAFLQQSLSLEPL